MKLPAGSIYQLLLTLLIELPVQMKLSDISSHSGVQFTFDDGKVVLTTDPRLIVSTPLAFLE